MLHSLGSYFYERRRGLGRAAAYIGGAYAVTRHVVERLGDVRDKMMQDKLARDNLKRRFEQNQQDISFTIMALLPTLGQHILEGMDVEGITQEIQSYSKTSQRRSQHEPPSLSSSIEFQSDHGHDAQSEVSSMSMISAPEDNGNNMSSSHLTGSSHGWVQPSATSSDRGQPNPNSDSEPRPTQGSPKSNKETDLSESIITSTDSSAFSYDEPPRPPVAVVPTAKSKAELWREVKILTFTRTLTTLYSMTLLSLFTHIQLNILGRCKYIQAVMQQVRDERVQAMVQDSFDISQLLTGSGPADLESYQDEDLRQVEPISEGTERKFLTLSWWILHVGWKDVGERVRRGVEEVFDSVSLKTKLSSSELHHLVTDVRRRVEYEVTFEGKERRINFMSTLIPPTPETLQHLLIQAGIPSRLAGSHDAAFQSLLAETRAQLSSPNLQRVLEVCLDRATETLFDGLEKNVFFESTLEAGLENSALGLGGMGSQEVNRVRLAGMLPGLARWCHLALEGLPNELLDGLASVREVSAFSAIIYSSYDDQFR